MAAVIKINYTLGGLISFVNLIYKWTLKLKIYLFLLTRHDVLLFLWSIAFVDT